MTGIKDLISEASVSCSHMYNGSKFQPEIIAQANTLVKYYTAGNFRPEKIFIFFAPYSHGQIFYPADFLSHINDHIDTMVLSHRL